MKALDPTSARMFPTLAAYARRVRWLLYGCVAAIIFTAGLACGLLVGSYRGVVEDQSYAYMVREFHQFKEDYLKHHAKGLTMTKAQAQVSAQKKEGMRNGGLP